MGLGMSDCCTQTLTVHKNTKSLEFSKKAQRFEMNQYLNQKKMNKPSKIKEIKQIKEIKTIKRENDDFISNYGSHFCSELSISHNTNISNTSATTHSSYYSCSHVEFSNYTNDANIILRHQRSATFQNDNEFETANTCQNVSTCKATKRIIKALKWRSLSLNNTNETNDKNHSILLQKIMTNQYNKFIMDDYQHLLSLHLFEFKLIRNEINKQMEPCNINKCVGFDRFLALSTKDLSKCNDNTFCVDFLDLIHCYIIHSQHLL